MDDQYRLNCERVTVWCVISRKGIIGPYFFEENGGTVTVNAARYREMIATFFLPNLEQMDIGNVWFQQLGDTARTEQGLMEILREHFAERLISFRGDLV